MSLVQNPEQTFRWGRVQCLMDKTTDKQLLLSLMGGRATYCCYEYYWTRSKEKAFTEWLEYMEKCIEMANKYGKHITWNGDDDKDDAILHIDEDGQETLYKREDFFNDGHYQTDTNEENVELINDWTDEHIPGEDETDDEEVRRCWTCDTRPATHRTYRDALEDYELTCDECHKDEYPEEYEEKEYYKVCCAENPDVEYFDTLHEAKAFCDKHADLDYGLIMLCDFEKNEIGDWGDYDEKEDDEDKVEEVSFLSDPGKKYLLNPSTNEIYNHAIFMETGDYVKVGTYNPETDDCELDETDGKDDEELAPGSTIAANTITSTILSLYDNVMLFGNIFSLDQFADEFTLMDDLFPAFREHIHALGRQGHFNELMKEYFEEWLAERGADRDD